MVEQEQAQGLGRRRRLIQGHRFSRAGRGLFLLVFGFALGGFFLTAKIRRALDDAPVSVEVEFPSSKEFEVDGWRGPAALEAAGLAFRLTPLHADPERQAFDSLALAKALGLPAGSPYRLEVQLAKGFDATSTISQKYHSEEDWQGLLSAPAAELVIRAGSVVVAQEMLHLARNDAPALRSLFRPGTCLEDCEGQIVMWGSMPTPESALCIAHGSEGLTLRSALYEGSKLPQHVAFLSLDSTAGAK